MARTWGSSPLARGTRGDGADDLVDGGLIPARAGNTMLHLSEQRIKRAHPRSRGEHRSTLPNHKKPLGSSPLARGTLSFK